MLCPNATIISVNRNIQDLQNTINHGLTFALVIHPIVCGLAFLTLIIAIITAMKQSKLINIVTGILSIITAILTTIVFIVDIVLAAVAKKKIEDVSDSFSVYYGSIPWLALVSAILLWLGTVSVCLSFFQRRR